MNNLKRVKQWDKERGWGRAYLQIGKVKTSKRSPNFRLSVWTVRNGCKIMRGREMRKCKKERNTIFGVLLLLSFIWQVFTEDLLLSLRNNSRSWVCGDNNEQLVLMQLPPSAETLVKRRTHKELVFKNVRKGMEKEKWKTYIFIVHIHTFSIWLFVFRHAIVKIYFLIS